MDRPSTLHETDSALLMQSYLREDAMPNIGRLIMINVVTFLVLGLLWLYASEWLRSIHCCAF